MNNLTPDRLRKIIHVDMDAFYASVEQRDRPELRGKPVAVGGERERGVVAAASYEARKFGVRSAMPSVTARRKCPDLIFVQPRFDVYKEISLQIRAIFAEYTSIIEPLSLDEAYLDVTKNLKGLGTATEIAQEIRRKIRCETGLTASAGVSYNKFLAKLASDHRKPDGLFVITPRMGAAFVEDMPVGKFHGVGPATSAKMNRHGIYTGLDLRAQTLSFLLKHFGLVGQHFYWIARGVDHRPVRADRVRKSIGVENTFPQDLFEFDAMREALRPMIDKIWRFCEVGGVRGRTVTLTAPPMLGGEYLRPEVLLQFWRALQEALQGELSAGGGSLQELLKSRDSRWRLVGRVHFNLAEKIHAVDAERRGNNRQDKTSGRGIDRHRIRNNRRSLSRCAQLGS
jgi:DNA polymerase-4